MSWTYKTWSEEVGEVDGFTITRTFQVRDRWIPTWYFDEEQKLWKENTDGFDSTTTT